MIQGSHSTVTLSELLDRPCSFSARQRYMPSPWGVSSTSSSTDTSSAVMVPTKTPSFSQVSVGGGFPLVLQCRTSVEPSCTVMELFTQGSRGGSASKMQKDTRQQEFQILIISLLIRKAVISNNVIILATHSLLSTISVLFIAKYYYLILSMCYLVLV